MHINLFGPTTVTDAGRRLTAGTEGVKPRQILEILAVSGETPVAKDQLAELLWEGRPPRSYLGTLESYVCLLRKSLGRGRGRDSVLRTVMRGYVLDQEAVTVDIVEFRRLVQTAGQTSDPGAALVLLEQAVALVQGDLLASEAYAGWAIRERRIFENELGTAGCAGAQKALTLHEADRAVSLARTAVGTDVLAEESARLLMRGLHRAGRSSEALRAYADLRAQLRDELGSDPSPRSQGLYLEILRDDRLTSAEHAADPREEVRTLVRLLRQALPHATGLTADARAGISSAGGTGEERELAEVMALATAV